MNSEILETDRDKFDILIMATTFCSKYDEWKDNLDIMNVFNINTNSFYNALKLSYPSAEDKVIQSISLAYLMTLFIICNTTHTENSIIAQSIFG